MESGGSRRQDWVDGMELRDGWNQVMLGEDSVLGRLGFWLSCIWHLSPTAYGTGSSHQLQRTSAAARTCDLTQVEDRGGSRRIERNKPARAHTGNTGKVGPDGRRV